MVTAAVLALQPDPGAGDRVVALRDVAAAAELLGVLRDHGGDRLTTWFRVSRPARDLVVEAGLTDPLSTSSEWYGLVELAGPAGADVDTALEAALGTPSRRDLVLDAADRGLPAQRSGLWALRERVSEAQEVYGPTVKHDVSVPITRLAEFVARTGPAVEAHLPGTRLFVYGHVGDGNLHYNLSRPADMSSEEFLTHAGALSDVVNASVAESVGSISAEHGLGLSKAAAAAAYKSDVEVALMRAVKDVLPRPRRADEPGRGAAVAAGPPG